MNRVVAILIFLAAGASLAADPGPDETALADRIVRKYYAGQGISDTAGRLLTSIVVEQEIRSVEDGVTTDLRAHLFMKDADTYLVYLKNERGESVCYLHKGGRQWVYRENLNNPLRVNMSQNVSGAANLGDLIGIDILKDFHLVSVEESSGAYVLGYERGRSSYPYPGIRVSVDAATEDIAAIEYLGLGERPMRRVLLEDYAFVSGTHRVPVWRIRNLVTDTQDSTTIRYLSIEPIDIPGAYFSPTGNALGHFLRWSDRVLR